MAIGWCNAWRTVPRRRSRFAIWRRSRSSRVRICRFHGSPSAGPEKGQPVKLIVQVPVNASFTTQVHIQTSEADPGVIAPFANCTPNGCFAEFDLREDILKKLREATSTGKLSFADAGGHDVTVPISFNGFAQAFDALAKKKIIAKSPNNCARRA